MRRVLPLLATVLLILAFGVGGFARAAPTEGDMRKEAFLLMGGTAADFCHQDAGHAHQPECSLCHLVAPCDLPGPKLTLASERRFLGAVILPRIAIARAQPRDPAIPPRGPPQTA